VSRTATPVPQTKERRPAAPPKSLSSGGDIRVLRPDGPAMETVSVSYREGVPLFVKRKASKRGAPSVLRKTKATSPADIREEGGWITLVQGGRC
jgi:hypothetical protein